MPNTLEPSRQTGGHWGDPMLSQPWRIRAVHNDTDDTFTLDLEPAEDGSRFQFAPGQFNMLYVFGVGEAPISISSDPSNSRVIQHTTREVGTVTRAMRRLKQGQALGVRGPFGAPWPVEECKGRDAILIAGGIGLAPLRPVLYRLLADRQNVRRIVLLYGARTPEDILFRRELERWRSKFDLEIYVTVDRATSGWRGNVGVVTTLIQRAPFDPHEAIAMICGPEVMMRFTIMELQRRGLSSQQIHLSMERNMKCGVGFCGHCQYGPMFVCKNGPVFRFDQIEWLFSKAEV